MALSDNIRMAWIRAIDKTKSSATHRGECSSKFLFIFGIGALILRDPAGKRAQIG
jgi:hypothetical protein